MTQEQDIVERLLERSREADDWTTSGLNLCDLLTEAAQTIAALRAERDELEARKNNLCMEVNISSRTIADENERAEAAEGKIKKLEAELERKHQNPTDYRYWEGRWRDTQAECDTAIRERDEARKALEMAESSTRIFQSELNDESARADRLNNSLGVAMHQRDDARKALEQSEAANFALSAGACVVENGLLGDDGGSPYCNITSQLDKLIETAWEFKPSAEVAFLWTKDTPPQEEVERYRRRYHALFNLLGTISSARAASSNREGGE